MPRAEKKLSILIVEDNPVNQLYLKALLSRKGHQVQLASDGAEAVRTYQEGAFDLIFMDLQMPGTDGFEAVSRIREIEAGGGPMSDTPPGEGLSGGGPGDECDSGDDKPSEGRAGVLPAGPPGRKTPISALSAYPLREETHREEIALFDHYLTKPVTKEMVEEALTLLTGPSEERN